MNDLEKNPENMTAEITKGGNSPKNLTGTSGGNSHAVECRMQ